jgi:hypothetical protein
MRNPRRERMKKSGSVDQPFDSATLLKVADRDPVFSFAAHHRMIEQQTIKTVQGRIVYTAEKARLGECMLTKFPLNHD